MLRPVDRAVEAQQIFKHAVHIHDVLAWDDVKGPGKVLLHDGQFPGEAQCRARRVFRRGDFHFCGVSLPVLRQPRRLLLGRRLPKAINGDKVPEDAAERGAWTGRAACPHRASLLGIVRKHNTGDGSALRHDGYLQFIVRQQGRGLT